MVTCTLNDSSTTGLYYHEINVIYCANDTLEVDKVYCYKKKMRKKRYLFRIVIHNNRDFDK